MDDEHLSTAQAKDTKNEAGRLPAPPPNSAATLAELAVTARRTYGHSVDAWLETAYILLRARELAAHGEWLPWLDRAGIPERTARRMLRVARAGFKSDSLADLGGIENTLDVLKMVDESQWLWREILGRAPAEEQHAVLEAFPDSLIGAARWREFGHALADATTKTEVDAAWAIAPWRRSTEPSLAAGS